MSTLTATELTEAERIGHNLGVWLVEMDAKLAAKNGTPVGSHIDDILAMLTAMSETDPELHKAFLARMAAR